MCLHLHKNSTLINIIDIRNTAPNNRPEMCVPLYLERWPRYDRPIYYEQSKLDTL